MTPDHLEKLRAKRDTLNARIRQAEAREGKRRRDEDTRIKVLIGACVKWHAEQEPERMAWLRERFFRFYPETEKHADKHELFDRLVRPAGERIAPQSEITPPES